MKAPFNFPATKNQQLVNVSVPTITGLAGAAVIACRAPFAGSVSQIVAAVNGAFTASDITITGRIGTNAITAGAITLATSGSAFGTSGIATPSAANTFSAGDIINCTITGGVGTVSGAVTFVLKKS